MRRGPSEAELARAFLATHGRQSAGKLLRLTVAEIHDLFGEMLDLPARHLSLQLRLPRLLSPEIEALRHAIDHGDDDTIDERTGPALSAVDTPERRAELGRAVLTLADSGRIDPDVVAAAMVDLDSRSRALMRASLLETLSLSVGTARTPSGLLISR